MFRLCIIAALVIANRLGHAAPPTAPPIGGPNRAYYVTGPSTNVDLTYSNKDGKWGYWTGVGGIAYWQTVGGGSWNLTMGTLGTATSSNYQRASNHQHFIAFTGFADGNTYIVWLP